MEPIDLGEVAKDPAIEPLAEAIDDDGQLDLVRLAEIVIATRDETAVRERLLPELRQQLEEERLSHRPDDPSAYRIDSKALELPDNVTPESLDTLPVVRFWRDMAHRMGVDQSEFEAGIKAFVETTRIGQPDPEAEKEKLGRTADERLRAVGSFVENLPPQHRDTAQQLSATADGVQLLEALMDRTRSPLPAGSSQAVEPRAVERASEMRKKAGELRLRPNYFSDPAAQNEAYALEAQAAELEARLSA